MDAKRTVVILALTVFWLLLPGSGPAARPTGALAAQNCWVRGEPATVDLIARQNADWRERVFSKYDLEVVPGGWRWSIKAGTGMLDALAPGMQMPGMEMEHPPTVLTVEHGARTGQGIATHTLTWGETSVDSATITWTLPPDRLCEGDAVEVMLRARIDRAPSVSDPVYREAAFEFTDGPGGSDETLFQIPDACRHRRGTIGLGGVSVGSAGGSDMSGRCRRVLGPLAGRQNWTLIVHLPEAFQVFYPYARE